MIISGKIGETIKVTGKNFSTVTRVNLLTEDCQFEVLNDNLMNIVIPSFGTSSFPVFSSDYTSSLSTGVDKISVYPAPLALDRHTGMYLDTIQMSGLYFSGVTGVKLNNIECPFSVLSNDSINFVIPSGDTRSTIKLQTIDGLESLSDFKFFPEILITGFNLSSATTGQNLQILGKYFFPELLLGTDSKFMVSFNGDQSTGSFTRIGNFILSGLIPTGAISGEVKIAKNAEATGLIEYYQS
jgi:hypothetical protein